MTKSNAELSPDGRWLAYQSDESGRPEIYVRPFPNVTSGRWQVSSGGGTRPMWARDGRSIFYTTQPFLTLMEVPVQASASFGAGTPVVVLKGPGEYLVPQYGRPYDVSLDGRRFLMIQGSPATSNVTTAAQSPLIVIQNWQEELTRLAPSN